MFDRNLFRGWYEGCLEVEPCFVEGDLQGVRDDFSTILVSDEDGNIREGFTVITSTIGQYTGLKDTSDNKIFEGDIVTGEAEHGQLFSAKVVFKDGCFEMHDEFNREVDYLKDWHFAVKITGNVHETPEQLTQK